MKVDNIEEDGNGLSMSTSDGVNSTRRQCGWVKTVEFGYGNSMWNLSLGSVGAIVGVYATINEEKLKAIIIIIYYS